MSSLARHRTGAPVSCRPLVCDSAEFDLALDQTGTYWFLEINPNGEWGWQQRCGLPIASALADLLNRCRRISLLLPARAGWLSGEQILPLFLAVYTNHRYLAGTAPAAASVIPAGDWVPLRGGLALGTQRGAARKPRK